MKYQTIIFDFDGVLCQDYFYSNIKQSFPEVGQFIDTKVFGQKNIIADKWMRGQITMDNVNQYICDNTGFDFNKLMSLFVESVRLMRVEQKMIELAQKLFTEKINIALVTNNMDVFNTITIKHHRLNEIFPVIVNSFDYGFLKHEKNGRLFDIAFESLGTKPYKNALLIDDSSKARLIFENRGGSTFPYESYIQFEPWMKENLI